MLYSKVKELCRDNGLNFAQLERALKFGNGTLQKWEKSTPGIDKVQAVAEYFETTVDELLGKGIHKFSQEAQSIAAEFEELSSDKKDLVRCYVSVLKAG